MPPCKMQWWELNHPTSWQNPTDPPSAYRLADTSLCHSWHQGSHLIPPPSRHFFCPGCGVVWMVAWASDRHHTVVHRCCEKCGVGAVASTYDSDEELACVPQDILATSLLRSVRWLQEHEYLPYV